MKYFYVLFIPFLLFACMNKEERAIREHNEAFMKSNGIASDEFILSYVVEDVKLDKSNQYAYSVSGMIRNKSNKDIKGYVKIKFLTKSGDVKKTALANVNDNDPITSGRSANFKYTASPLDFKNVTNFEVVFIEK